MDGVFVGKKNKTPSSLRNSKLLCTFAQIFVDYGNI